MVPAIRILFVFATSALAAPVHLVDETPASIKRIDEQVILIDFGRVAFGNLQIAPSGDGARALTVHFGEDLRGGRINRKPGGTIRYAFANARLDGRAPVLVAPPRDPRNTSPGNATTPPAVITPPEWGVVLPFRWVEIEGWPGELTPSQIIRKAAFASTWDDQAAAFSCSDAMLNRIWELCRYSIKATTFAGVYVDGDRERIPYEADAYLNQLSHYHTDHDKRMARDTFDWLMKHPTWPTEWAFHMVFMAHADHLHTGDTAWLAARFDSLKPKLLLERAREDGLLLSGPRQITKEDIIDWPVGERDGFVFKPVNTVVNAFHIRALWMMSEMAVALGRNDEGAGYAAMASKAQAAFHSHLFDPAKGRYRDGVGTDHASQHANLFPLAFGLVPAEHTAAVADFVQSRGMACSVYAAQYLMEGLFSHDRGDRALALMTATGDRSWRHMVDRGATISWEAWDTKYKPNQDWNHAWGAAPANLLPRFVLGAEPLAPRWKRARIRPIPGTLHHASGKIPTPLGPIVLDWRNGSTFAMNLQLPDAMTARLELPALPDSKGVSINGRPVKAKRDDGHWLVDEDVSGTLRIEVARSRLTAGQP